MLLNRRLDIDMIKTISTIKDPLIVSARKLNKPSSRLQYFLLEGKEQLLWGLDANLPIKRIFLKEGSLDDSLVQRLSSLKIDCFHCSDGILKKINESKYLIPVIAVAKAPSHIEFPSDDLVLMLDDIQDQGNMGTIIRSAMALGVSQMISCGRSRDIYNKKTISASRGTCFRVQNHHYEQGMDALRQLQSRGYRIIATSPQGRTLQALAPLSAKPTVLVVGNETQGLSDELMESADLLVKIPMENDVESLNVGVAAGISIFELKIKVLMGMLTNNIQNLLGRNMSVAMQLSQRVLDLKLQQSSSNNAKQLILMMIMVCDEAMSLAQIEKDLALYGEALDLILQPLLQQGCVIKTDRGYSVTSAGEERLAKAWQCLKEADDVVLQGFSEKEAQALHDYLRRIQKNCHSYLDNES